MNSPTHQITRRNISIPAAADQRYFIHDRNPVGSALFVVLSAMFPPGEMFFIESIRNVRDQLTDKKLLEDVRNFIAQEAFHSREHLSLNRLLVDLGYPEVTEIEAKTKAGLNKLRMLSVKEQLAATVVMEHFTASLAKSLLTDNLLIQKTSQESRNLWEWHALEELEHKSVAFDVLNAVNANGQLVRIKALIAVTREIIPITFMYWIKILNRKDIQFSASELKDAIYFAFGGINRLGILTKAFVGMVDVIFKNFNPNNMNTTEIEAICRERLFGKKGHLIEHMKYS